MLDLLLSFVLAQVTPEPSPAASAVPPAPSAPALAVSPASLNLNPAQQQVLAVSDATPPLQLTLERRIVEVTAAPDGRSVTVTATQATGSDTLQITDATGATAQIPIRVAFNAGTIVGQTTLAITGNPAQPQWLAQQVSRWVMQATQAMPGAQVTLGPVAPPALPLAPGGTLQFAVPVQIAGNGEYFDQSGTTTVTVEDQPLAPFAPGLLFYDDDPEHVSQDGVLFRGTVSLGQPARLYYYHDDAGDPRRLVVALQANSEDPTSLQMIEATAGPNIDVMQVGQTVTKTFLLTKSQHEGLIADLSSDRPLFVSDVPMTARQLVAGAIDLRVLTGGPVAITVLAVSPGADPQALMSGPLLPGDGHHRTGLFSIAGFGTADLQYAAGGGDAAVVLGDTDPTPQSVDPSGGGHDYGSYGVLQTIDATLSNPSPEPATAYLFLQPLAGPARGSFLIDGSLVDIGCVRVPARYQVTAFPLSPGATLRAVVQTMTDGGSFYPVRVGFTATPPVPSAPPISAPDGCFPKAQAPPAQ